MRNLRTRATLLTTAILFTAAAVLLGSGGVPATVHYISHDKVTQVMSKVRGAPIVSDPGLRVLAQRREAGPAEYHDHNNHVFIFVDGEATFIVGGTMVDPKRTAPNQMRAPSVTGGNDLPCEQRRRDYDSCQDAPLVQGSPPRKR